MPIAGSVSGDVAATKNTGLTIGCWKGKGKVEDAEIQGVLFVGLTLNCGGEDNQETQQTLNDEEDTSSEGSLSVGGF